MDDKVLHVIEALLKGNGLATLAVDTTEKRMVQGIPWEEVPLVEPAPWIPTDRNSKLNTNDRTLNWLNETVNVQIPKNVRFDSLTYVVGITATVRNTASSTNPATGFAHRNDQFLIQMVRSGINQTFQSSPVMGSTVVGTAELTRYTLRPTMMFPAGSTLTVNVTPLVANLSIDLVFQVIEILSGTNVTAAM